MTSYDIPGSKSKVHISPEKGIVTKQYVNPPLTLGDTPALAAPSALEAPEQRFFVETGVLRSLHEGGERCAPQFYGADADGLSVDMEYLNLPSRRDQLAERARKALSPRILEGIARDVAAIHEAFGRRDSQIMEATRGPKYELHVRVPKEMEEKVWGYVRSIITATAPELKGLREATMAKLRDAKAILRDTYKGDHTSEDAQRFIREKTTEL